jgi:hypothetical protein
MKTRLTSGITAQDSLTIWQDLLLYIHENSTYQVAKSPAIYEKITTQRNSTLRGNELLKT